MEHEIRRKIILKFIHAPRLSFNKIWNKEGDSNLIAYHLKKLEEEGLVRKYDDGYGLTDEGIKQSAFIEGDTGGKAELVTPIVIIVVRDGDKILCQERLKEPFFGYWGVISGKINFGWNPAECALRDLEEETSLIAKNPRLIGIECTKSMEGEKLMHHFIFFTYEVTEFAGTLRVRTHKAVNKFLTRSELESLPHFPGDWTQKYFSPSDKLEIVERVRHTKDGHIVGDSIESTHWYQYLANTENLK